MLKDLQASFGKEVYDRPSPVEQHQKWFRNTQSNGPVQCLLVLVSKISTLRGERLVSLKMQSM